MIIMVLYSWNAICNDGLTCLTAEKVLKFREDNPLEIALDLMYNIKTVCALLSTKEITVMNTVDSKRRNIPAGIQDFEKLRDINAVYVDKTEYVYKLAKTSVPFF